jgi:hypothetical protein
MTQQTERFTPGATAVRRDVFGGKVYSAHPQRVVSDTEATLAIARWPGLAGFGPTSWIEALRTDNPAARKDLVPQLARGDWTLGPWTWQNTTCLALLYPGAIDTTGATPPRPWTWTHRIPVVSYFRGSC